jgi:hypothetical protein
VSRYISFSQLKNWAKCPFYHKLQNIDKVEGGFNGNIYTAFGSALHEVIEHHLEKKINNSELKGFFGESFDREIASLSEEVKEDHLKQFKSQGETLVTKYKSALDSYFGDYEIIKCEEELFEDTDPPASGTPFKFKGYIDLVVKVGDTEIFKVTSGKRRTENAMKLLATAIHNIDKGVVLKNRSACLYCEFKGTKHCP